MDSEYLIVFSPPKWIKEQVEGMKKGFATQYGDFRSRYSRAHVTVGNLLLPCSRAEMFFKDLAERISEVEAFEFVIDGFNAFPHSGTIFADFAESGNFVRVVKKFHHVVRLHGIEDYHTSYTPHMTIASGLDNDRFARAYYGGYFAKEYKESFEAYELTVLVREIPNSPFRLYGNFPLFDPSAMVVGSYNWTNSWDSSIERKAARGQKKTCLESYESPDRSFEYFEIISSIELHHSKVIPLDGLP